MSINGNDKYLRDEIERMREEIVGLQQEIERLQKKNLCLQTEYENNALAYETISKSRCWRMTAPLRYGIDVIKSLMEKSCNARLLGKGINSLRRNGVRVTYQKMKLKLSNKTSYSAITFDCSRLIEWKSMPLLEKCEKKIAIHLHLFYADLLDEFIEYLNNMPYSFDLFISTRQSNDLQEIKEKCSNIRNVENCDIRVVQNRGRDIAPLYVEFCDVILHYDYFLHVHTKKSLYTGTEQRAWRSYSLEALLGSEEQIRKIFSLFEKQSEKIGIFYPEPDGNFPMWGLDWLANSDLGKQLMTRLCIKPDIGLFYYPVGSFFWARVSALKPIFDLKFRLEDFPEENGQTDGTLAHALERVIQFVVSKEGQHSAIYDFERQCISLDRSIKKFMSYFNMDVCMVRDYLSAYDVITFDIFDTLITRNIYEPDDLFRLMERIIKNKYGKEVSFPSLRKHSESIACHKKGKFCCIEDIYAAMGEITGWSANFINEIKQLEIKLEYQLVVPRSDMVTLIKKLRHDGKKIILLSDMYLTEQTILEMLQKCGYGTDDFQEIWISCELGMRKDDGSMWDHFFSIYGCCRTIHVGDNTRSDIQMVADRKHDTFYVMNPRYQLKLSPWDTLLRSVDDGSVDTSICKGMIVNGMLFNSPFCVNKFAKPVIKDFFQIGFIGFGMLLSGFMKEIYGRVASNAKLLFLSRDGYLLKKIYDRLYPGSQAMYFLTSRRAASVAAIRNESDIRTILRRQYRGGLFNLIRSRLGYELSEDEFMDINIEMPRDLEKVIKIIGRVTETILKQASKERIAYQQYADSQLFDCNRLAIVDLGYSGTIQSYLKKLLVNNIHGYYLVCSSIMQIKENEYTCLYTENSSVFKNQLFLEAALQAPYGQLLHFVVKNGKVRAIYKDDDMVSEDIIKVQDGIIAYAEHYKQLVEMVGDISILPEFAEAVFAGILDNKITDTGNALEVFCVQDDYCSNGSLFYKNGSWDVL